MERSKHGRLGRHYDKYQHCMYNSSRLCKLDTIIPSIKLTQKCQKFPKSTTHKV